MKNVYKLGILLTILSFSLKTFSQTDLNQNGWKSTVTNTLVQNSPEAVRYEIATLGYNSYHWQNGGIIFLELFEQTYGTGYEKYIIENGYGQGANSGTAVLKLIEFHGLNHSGKISLGTPYDLSTSFGDHVNRALPIYLDVKDYAGYKVKITYMQNKVDVLNFMDQIKINIAPTSTVISGFTAPAFMDENLTSRGQLMVVGSGDHYIQNGNLSIGTTDPRGYKLAVAGNMIAESVKVKLQGAWPDYVFTKDYILPTIEETEDHIKKTGHLSGIPTAKEVKANGIDLGEMNAKLLQKIEELTLQLIEQNRKFEAKFNTQQLEIDTFKLKLK